LTFSDALTGCLYNKTFFGFKIILLTGLAEKPHFTEASYSERMHQNYCIALMCGNTSSFRKLSHSEIAYLFSSSFLFLSFSYFY